MVSSDLRLRTPLSFRPFFQALGTSSFLLNCQICEVHLSSSQDEFGGIVRVIGRWSWLCKHMTWYLHTLRGNQLIGAMSLTCYNSCQPPKAKFVCVLMASTVLVKRHEVSLVSHSRATKQRSSCSTCLGDVTLDRVIVACALHFRLAFRAPYTPLHSTTITKRCSLV